MKRCIVHHFAAAKREYTHKKKKKKNHGGKIKKIETNKTPIARAHCNNVVSHKKQISLSSPPNQLHRVQSHS